MTNAIILIVYIIMVGIFYHGYSAKQGYSHNHTILIAIVEIFLWPFIALIELVKVLHQSGERLSDRE